MMDNTCVCSVAQSCLAVWDSMDCSPPGFSVHGFFRQEYWGGLSFPSPGGLPNPGTEPGSPALQADTLTSEPLGLPRFKGLDLIDRVPDELWIEVHDIVQETGLKTIPMEKKCKKAKWLSGEALQIALKSRTTKPSPAIWLRGQQLRGIHTPDGSRERGILVPNLAE